MILFNSPLIIFMFYTCLHNFSVQNTFSQAEQLKCTTVPIDWFYLSIADLAFVFLMNIGSYM